MLLFRVEIEPESAMPLDYHRTQALFRNQPEWKLLRAEHAPLVLSFLHFAFVQGKERIIPEPVLVSKLEDVLYSIRLSEGEDAYPRSAAAYLDDWADIKKGWLRKFYQKGSDDAQYDLTPATEKALQWVESLAGRDFVGTESRLLTLFELLRQMVQGTEEDAEVRIAELEKQKQQLERQIQALKRGEVEIMGDTALRDRFLQFSSTARELLSDFRQVEHNFRKLDMAVREKIATWEGGKGDLLEAVFGERDAITDSDQGQSFNAFWDFLMSAGSQEEFSAMLEKVLNLDGVRGLEDQERLKDIHYQWLDAGEQTQKTVAALSQQLRRFLDNQTWLENRRIMQLVDSISRKAIQLKNESEDSPSSATEGKRSYEKQIQTQLQESRPAITVPLDRPLYTVKEKLKLDSSILEGNLEETDSTVLFQQVWVDKEQLHKNIRWCLQQKSQMSLGEVVEHFPLEKGLSELVAYLSVAESGVSGVRVNCVVNEEQTQQIRWGQKTTEVPLVLFLRNGAEVSDSLSAQDDLSVDDPSVGDSSVDDHPSVGDSSSKKV